MSKKSAKIQSRPPIVVVLGHVDHGKTSILDKIRETKVVEKELGGITQHISACQIKFQKTPITFIDTPGHKIFAKMRAHGAKIADIALLVVASDEGVKTQTIEAIKYINKEKIPTLVAFNKIDKPIADVEKAKTQLAEKNILVEGRGGDIPCVGVSAQTGQGLDDLLELILLLAEMQELKRETCKKGMSSQGIIIESFMDSKRGNVSLAIVQKGVINTGDFLKVGRAFGRLKILENWRHAKIQKAKASDAVFIIGLNNLPESGKVILSSKDEITDKEYLKLTNKTSAPAYAEAMAGMQELKKASIAKESNKEQLNLIIKADAHGTLQAILDSLSAVKLEKISLNILHSGIGSISESDVKSALPTRALLIGFRVKPDKIAKDLIQIYKLNFKSYDVIYEIISEIQEISNKLIKPEKIRNDLGKVKIVAVFKHEKDGQVIGGPVLFGRAVKNAQVEVIRNEEKIGQGRIKKLEHKNNDVGEVSKGREAGIYFQGEIKIQEGDILEVFKIEKQMPGIAA